MNHKIIMAPLTQEEREDFNVWLKAFAMNNGKKDRREDLVSGLETLLCLSADLLRELKEVSRDDSSLSLCFCRKRPSRLAIHDIERMNATGTIRRASQFLDGFTVEWVKESPPGKVIEETP